MDSARVAWLWSRRAVDAQGEARRRRLLVVGEGKVADAAHGRLRRAAAAAAAAMAAAWRWRSMGMVSVGTCGACSGLRVMGSDDTNVSKSNAAMGQRNRRGPHHQDPTQPTTHHQHKDDDDDK